ncbi:membrane integrity-associated transporter subunit PqiC [bacterium]|nr:membrane integrity-associated transporter subunit PqiC [bacterium]
MKRYALAALAAGMAVLLGCSKGTMLRRYYVLEPQRFFTRADFGLEAPLPFKVDVREFIVAKPFAQTRIATRSASHEMNYYQYHSWATRPGSAVTFMVYRLVENSTLFSRTSYGFTVDADYIITGDIHELELIEEKKHMSAHLGMTLRLIRCETDKPEVRYDFDRTVELEENTMNQFAWIISELLREETEHFLKEATAFLAAEGEAGQ